MAEALPGLPAGLPKVSELVKPAAEMEAKMISPIKSTVKPMIEPVYKFLTTPLSAMGIEVMAEAPTPVEAAEFAAKQLEAGKLPIPTKMPGAEMIPKIPGAEMIPKLPSIPGVGSPSPASSPSSSPGSHSSPVEEEGGGTFSSPEYSSPSPEYSPSPEGGEVVLPEEARPGGVISSLYSLEERRRRMWMSL